jgi:glycerol-3-phosphate cytidylyltransferase-like family protein
VDTRQKILAGAVGIRAASDATLVIAYFDVLRREHVRALEQAIHPVIVVVLEKTDAILPLQARAELAAGLRGVTYVVTAAEAEVAAIVAAVRPAHLLRLVEQERHWTAQLRERVQRGAR